MIQDKDIETFQNFAKLLSTVGLGETASVEFNLIYFGRQYFYEIN
jgi:hypothetical protein